MRVGQIEKNILYPQLGNSRFGNGRFAKQLTTWKAVSIEEFGKDYVLKMPESGMSDSRQYK